MSSLAIFLAVQNRRNPKRVTVYGRGEWYKDKDGNVFASKTPWEKETFREVIPLAYADYDLKARREGREKLEKMWEEGLLIKKDDWKSLGLNRKKLKNREHGPQDKRWLGLHINGKNKYLHSVQWKVVNGIYLKWKYKDWWRINMKTVVADCEDLIVLERYMRIVKRTGVIEEESSDG
jgi:hypothetical protein